VTIEGDRFGLPLPFIVLATQNPIDLEGTYPLPEAQIDRFLVHIAMGYPSAKDEATMLRTYGADPPVPSAVLSASEVLSLQAMVDRIHVDTDLADYAVALTHFTRIHPKVTLGCSPRATLGLLQAAKALALMEGRPFLTPDDIRAVAPSVLAHRLVLNGELEGNANARRSLIEEALSKVSYRRSARPL
jgi:MoxR-like ATPase